MNNKKTIEDHLVEASRLNMEQAAALRAAYDLAPAGSADRMIIGTMMDGLSVFAEEQIRLLDQMKDLITPPQGMN